MSGRIDDAGDDAFDIGLDGAGPNGSADQASEGGAYAIMTPRDLIIAMSWRSVRLPRKWHARRTNEGLVTIIQVPSQAWVAPLGDYLRDHRRGIVLVDGKAKAKDVTTSDSAIIAGLDRGLHIVGIAVDPPSHLSALLRGAADDVVIMPAPTPELMRGVIAAFTGRRCPAIAALDIAGLDLRDLAVALRPNTTPASCVKRLRRASSARNLPVDDATPPLAELAGYGEARRWCLDVVSDISAVVDGRISAGELESAIFFGPPGTGKTLLARSLARTSRLPLIQTSVSAWFHDNAGHLGDVLRHIDDVFTRARNSAPSIIFLDELDAIPDRKNMDSRSRDWWNSVVTSLLLQIDAARNSKRGVIMLAATNHIEHIDAALLRPGRFDCHFRIDPPDASGLAGIMRGHLGKDCADADLKALATLMPGATGAEVTGIIRTARRQARQENRPLTAADLKAAILPASGRTFDELRHVAIHEAGHAVVASALGFQVGTVSIRATGKAGGWTDVAIPSIPTLLDIERHVMVLLAGRAANMAFGSVPDTGAVSDLSEATRLIGAAKVTFGLGDTLVVRAPPDDVLNLVARDRALADAIGRDLGRLMTQTRMIVAANLDAIGRLADQLVERLVLDAQEHLARPVDQPPERSGSERLGRRLS